MRRSTSLRTALGYYPPKLCGGATPFQTAWGCLPPPQLRGGERLLEVDASMAGRSCVPWACGGLVVCVVGALRGTFRVRPSHLQGSQAAYLEHVCCMLLSLYCPVTCDPYRAVTLPNIGIPHRGTYPYSAPGHTHPLFKSPSDVYGWFGGVLHRGRIVQ